MAGIVFRVAEYLTVKDTKVFLTTHFRSSIIVGTVRCRQEEDYNACPFLLETADKTWAIRKHELQGAIATLQKAKIPYTLKKNDIARYRVT